MKHYRAMRTNKPQLRAAASVDIKPKQTQKSAFHVFPIKQSAEAGSWELA